MDHIKEVRERFWASKAPVILTGAGVSAESGVPTFRGEGGLWRDFRPEDLATPEAFMRDPVLVWEWYEWRRAKIASVKPNPAHYAMAEMEERFLGPAGKVLGKEAPGRAHERVGNGSAKRFTLITQNVDGLHALSGSRNIIELHGSIWRVRCVRCGVESENRDVPLKILPHCRCGGVLRPAVVWFGEMLPVAVIDAAFEASGNSDFMLVAGTSGIVQPAASLARRAKDAGAFVAEINTESTPLSGVMDATLLGRAAELMPRLL